ncbi:uncharacterized protein AC631_03837 [Debaryomyces fabryi]|uniref:Nuclear pore complex protein n=1 Tax=Debaryomyces fabryi TaxID=58627 RepID=A0A0V1PWD5_9ASCO|nr:uncharacterized protein AC631_03837 [Debaryomyces fabryi]KSA00410.1 hypothetical protein AC631_03837 [Debaryomyces fabryi]CUM54142.1 unnamed protein product [Debaryomyces fabryi]
MVTSMVVQDEEVANNPETQFANVLQGYQLNNQKDIFEIIGNFKSICALNALLVGEKLSEEEPNSELQEEFENWDLETKLWHLVESLYSFRLSISEEPYKEYPFSSLSVKQENFLRKNPKVREISLMIHWLQTNSKSIDFDDSDVSSGKWQNTRQAIQNKDLEVLTHNGKQSDNIVDYLDSDSPLRSGKRILPVDNDTDSRSFYLIYKLVLANRIQEAIDYANLTGNFTLALILIGAIQDYVDPVIDQEFINPPLNSDNMFLDSLNNGKSEDDSPFVSKPSGIRHKLLWKKTVYKLSQQPNLNRNEKLIYNYLSGGNIALNLEDSSDNWEEYLLLYLNQLYIHNLESFVVSSLPKNLLEDETLSLAVPKPQFSSVDDILNALLKSENEVAEKSTHPLRIIMGGIMINQVSTLIHNIIRSLSNASKDSDSDSIISKSHLLRVVTHLAIFELIAEERNNVNVKDITKVMTLYVSKLSEMKLAELIPIYLSFISDEKDARECYSLFLSSITDTEERSKQIAIAKKFSNITTPIGEDLLVHSDTGYNEDKMFNILRRTVERVMIETEPHYKQSSNVIVHDDISKVDDADYKLYRSVEWFFENSMHEDAISASITIMRRFLLCGKVSSLKQFGKDKNFKQLIKEYDLEAHINSISSPNVSFIVSEDDKEELLNYESLILGLLLIDDWKQFLKDNKINGVLSKITPNSFWKSNHINNSIEKVTNTLTKLIFQWLSDLIASASKGRELFKELRIIYVPYLIMELLQIYQYSRLNNWSYMRRALKLVTEVANEDENDFLNCFVSCGRLDEFLVRCGEISVIASERGIKGIFH